MKAFLQKWWLHIVVAVMVAVSGGSKLLPHFQHKAPEAKVVLPEALSGDVGDFVEVKAVTDCKIVKWCFDKGISHFALPDGKTVYLSAKKPGRYCVKAYTASTDVPSNLAVCVVDVKGDVPPPPPPPAPVDDPFVKALQTAYNQAPNPASLKYLQETYAQAAENTVNDRSITLLIDLHNQLHIAIQKLINDDLKPVRQAIETEMNSKLPVDPKATLDSCRDAVRVELAKIASALKGVH